MKKGFLLLTGMAGVFFSSCKKEKNYTCNCSYSYGGATYTYHPFGMDRSVTSESESDAQNQCKDNWISAYATANGETTAYATYIWTTYGMNCAAAENK
ncbi:MAG: hypothetical protein R2799_09395 [Crocinitomicaceae bacterium]